jgi:aspartate/methionine/tyrosine aminotransferase
MTGEGRVRMNYQRMVMEVEAPEQIGYDQVRYNLAESSMSDRVLGDLGLDLAKLVLRYDDHRGHPALREAIAADGIGALTADDVLICAGAAGALFTVASAMLGAGDHLIVAHPNYASNFETPRAIGAEIEYLRLKFDEGWAVDPERVAALIRPETRLVSLTTPHNPTGTEIPETTLQAIINAVERSNAYLLLDETYRELAPVMRPPWAARSSRVISVSSLSKTYGIPGIRVGWIICRDTRLKETLLAAKEQIMLGGSVVDEEIALGVMRNREHLLAEANAHAAAGFALIQRWIEAEPLLEWVEPTAGVVCFPRIAGGAGIDPVKLHQLLNQRYGVFAGPGHWFEQEARYMRIGYGYPSPEDLSTALDHVSAALREEVVGP